MTPYQQIWTFRNWMNFNQRAKTCFPSMKTICIIGAIIILLIRQITITTLAVIIRVIRRQGLNPFLHSNIQCFVGSSHICPPCVTTFIRDNICAKHSSKSLNRHVGTVMMPTFIPANNLYDIIIWLTMNEATFTYVTYRCSREFKFPEHQSKVILTLF